MKKLLTIFLLIILASQASGYFHAKVQELSFMQEADDKGEKSGEEKKGKEYIPLSSFSNAELFKKRTFRSYSCHPRLSPVPDNHTPPPDGIT